MTTKHITANVDRFFLRVLEQHSGKSKKEVANRINQAKIAFWKKATILRSNISMKTRIRILMCYVFSVVSYYGCETWTFSKAIDHKINAFEMWCYRRMLRISWTSHTTNIDVLQKIGVKETTMLNNLANRKLYYAGHILRNTSGHYDTLMTTIEGRLEGRRGRGGPRRTWVDDIREWTGSKRYNQIKRAAENWNLHGTFATHSSGRNIEWTNEWSSIRCLWNKIILTTFSLCCTMFMGCIEAASTLLLEGNLTKVRCCVTYTSLVLTNGSLLHLMYINHVIFNIAVAG